MLDADMQAVMAALGDAQQRSGLTQTEFARAIGTSGSRYSTYRSGRVSPSATLLMRAIRIADLLAASRAAHLPTAPDAARSVRQALHGERSDWALSLILGVRDRILCDARSRPQALTAWSLPASTGDARWDRLLAAVIRHAHREAGQPPPEWTAMPALESAWTPVESLRFDSAQTQQRTPEWLAECNIFIADHDLATL